MKQFFSIQLSVGVACVAIGFPMPALAEAIRNSNTLNDRIPSTQADLFSSIPLTAPMAQAEGDIVDVALADGSFLTLISLLEQLGMAEDLRGYGRFTVFAPTDEAFQDVPNAILEALLADRELMAKVLAYHVVSGADPLYADDLRSVDQLRTLSRGEIEIDRRRGSFYVNDARVIATDIEASNGVIHAIDQVLIPSDVMSQILSNAH